ncbi:hypothetical protein GCM10023175_38300 [Pseudonocardia xishanensis]|uniref:Glycoside hydrolase family 42 N-terminal domain-containing protein n=1 Tax=Pseudonocardia xishanensis TaxID=630995 RepID=A0ABP8RWG7_9PSEU
MSRGAGLVAAVLVAAVVVVAGCGTAAAPGPGPSAPSAPGGRPVFGTLVSEPDRSAEEARAGVGAAMVELSWAEAEPADDRFDAAYLRRIRADLDALRATGRSVTLGLGLHDTPRWVLDLPGGRYVAEDGAVSTQADLVFNQRSRDKAEEYLAQVAAVLGPRNVDAVRLTAGGSAEVLYPGGGRYWAFGPNAQGGPGRPASLPPNPLPGWRPGDPGPGPDAVRSWADWYVGALVDVVEWQTGVMRSLGFAGPFEVLTPGVGVLPADYDAAVAAGLPPGLLGTGAAWERFYAGLAGDDDLVAYVSSVADGSGGDGGCAPGDDRVPVDDPSVATWSSTRWITRLAVENGLPVAGENPGWGQSEALDRAYVEQSDTGMLARAVEQARSCGFTAFYWAHDAQLWDGTMPFAEYAARIAA